MTRQTKLNWRKSTRSSADDNCVQVAVTADDGAVRDSAQPPEVQEPLAGMQ